MKTIIVTETDQKFVDGIAPLLLEAGALATENPTRFKASEELARDLCLSYHGLRIDESEAFKENFKDVVDWLENYTGNFPFYLSLKGQLTQKGSLSEKQVESVKKAIARDNRPAPVREYSIAPGTSIRVGKYFARQIAAQAGMTDPHFVFDVIQVLGETEKAYKLLLKMSARRTTHCSICGIKLSNKASILAGVGPICADKWGIPYGEESLGKLEAKIKDTVSVETWIPKSVIKERYEILNNETGGN